MKFVSTRGLSAPVSAAEAIVRGLAPDGGLYVPEKIPRLPAGFMKLYGPMSYPRRAAAVLRLFLPEFDGMEQMCEEAYSRFDAETGPAPLVGYGRGLPHALELFHGPTCAFKDMALQLLPGLLKKSMEMTGETREICILAATSGDTGKAALEGFRDVPGTRILVFYPRDGVSDVQKRQMTAQEGGNVGVCGVFGNFDDAQAGVKRVFADAEFAGNLPVALSSANSINLGRLLPQIAYYVSAAVDFMAGRESALHDKRVDFCVPTGNFGNILAAWYAREMGAPVGRLLCASNQNDVLTQLISEGVYDANRPFYATLSPSMDILVSSNWERALYHLSGRDGRYVRECMESLACEGRYALRGDVRGELERGFFAGSCGDAETEAAMASVYARTGRVVDPHTAVAFAVSEKYAGMHNDARPCVVVSTAHPAKFPEAVRRALGGTDMLRVPLPLSDIFEKPERFLQSVPPDGIADIVKDFALAGGNNLIM